MSSGDKYIFYPQNKPLESGWIIFLFWYKDVRRRQANNSQMSQETGWVLLLNITVWTLSFFKWKIVWSRLIHVICWTYLPVTTIINCLTEKLWYLERGRGRELSWAELYVGELLYWWGLAGLGRARLGEIITILQISKYPYNILVRLEHCTPGLLYKSLSAFTGS